jgi:hypothetical protein
VHSSNESVSEMGSRCEVRKAGEWCVRWAKERAARQRGQGGLVVLLVVMFGEGVVGMVGLVGEAGREEGEWE